MEHGGMSLWRRKRDERELQLLVKVRTVGTHPAVSNMALPNIFDCLVKELSSHDGNSWEMAFCQVQFRLGKEFLWAHSTCDCRKEAG